MYKIGKYRPRWKRRIAAFLIILLLGAAGTSGIIVYLTKSTNNATEIQASAGGIRAYNPEKEKAKLLVDEPLYAFELPGDWKVAKRNEDPRYNSVEWQMGDRMRNRWLKIYVDRFPEDMPFNRIMPVSIENTRIIENSPSGNCADFTNAGVKNNTVKVVKAFAKWDGVTFLCDLDNTIDNVAAAGSAESGTALSITGGTKGLHRYLIVYTDRSIPSDDSPFRDALQSFVAK